MKKVILKPVVLAAVILGLSPARAAESEAETPDPSVLDLERIFVSDDFASEDAGPVKWLEGEDRYATLEDSEAHEGSRDIFVHDPATGEKKILVSASSLVPPGEETPLKIDGYALSSDGSRVLIYTASKRVWRAKTRGDYWVLDITSRELRRLGGDARSSSVMFATFSPGGTRVCYVRDNDLYVEDLRARTIVRLTQGGSPDLIHGTFDWVYEEEFRLRRGFRWSPDSRHIAYWTLDAKNVREFYLINNTDSLYPELIPIKYPKTGEKNAKCRVGVVSAGGGPTTWIDVPGDPSEHYIVSLDWVENPQELVLQQLNRLQNTLKVMAANPGSGETRLLHTERDEAWIDVETRLRWTGEDERFLLLSETDGWRHLYSVPRSGGRATLLTPGEFDVLGIDGVDEKNGWVYVTASPDDPLRRYLFRVSLRGGGERERVTPETFKGTNTYRFSESGLWAVHVHSTFRDPPVTRVVGLPEHRSVGVLAENKDLKEAVDALETGASEFFRAAIGDGVELDAWCLKPADFDPDKRYPLLLYVYGEPAGQSVLDRWMGKRHLWHLMLTQKGYVVMSIDNRGTPAPRGREWRKSIYRQVGILASADQAAALQTVLADRPYLDPERVGIWGVSGGGSMSLNAIFRYPRLYRTAMAVSFVSNQRYYDTIYQERYMGLPSDNVEGYKHGSPITYAGQLEGNLLLVHGTGDDNCHYQSLEALANELIAHNKPFSMMAYPNRTHSLKKGKNTRLHYYTTLTRFLEANLPVAPEGEPGQESGPPATGEAKKR